MWIFGVMAADPIKSGMLDLQFKFILLPVTTAKQQGKQGRRRTRSVQAIDVRNIPINDAGRLKKSVPFG